MPDEVRFAARQMPPPPTRVIRVDDHYQGECTACEACSVLTWDRWAARFWAISHRCGKEQSDG
jgi:hypothetical protein